MGDLMSLVAMGRSCLFMKVSSLRYTGCANFPKPSFAFQLQFADFSCFGLYRLSIPTFMCTRWKSMELR